MVVFSFFVVWCFSFCCVSVSFFFFLSTRTRRLAPTARTLLGGLEHALFIFFVVAARLFLVFASILLLCCWSAHKSLAPRTRTLLGVLGHATLNFVAVATLLFFSFCVCPKFCDLAKQQRKMFVGVSEVGRIDFALYFFWLCVFFSVFLFLPLQSRDGRPTAAHQWYKNNQYLFYEDRIVVPEARLDGCLQWAHLSSGHTGANRSVDFFGEWFYSSLTLTELRSRMQTIVDACGCHASKQSNSRDMGLISSLPIPYCTNSLLYVDFIHGLPRFGGYDSCLVVTCGLSCFTRVFPCNKKITGEQTVKMLVEPWFEPYGAPKQVHSDENARIRSDTGWYKRVLNALNVEVSTGVPYTHTSNPLCERQNHVVEQNLRILMKQERTKDWVRLVPWAVLTMNSQRSSSTGFTPHQLFHGGRSAWFFKIPLAEDFKSPVWDWMEHKQSMANDAGTNLRHIHDRELSRRNRVGLPASFARHQTRHTQPQARGPKRPEPRQGATTPHHETHGPTPGHPGGGKVLLRGGPDERCQLPGGQHPGSNHGRVGRCRGPPHGT